MNEMKFDIKTLVAMLSVCMLAPITPSSYVPTWGINHVAAAQMEQAQDMDYLVLVNKTHKLPSNYEAIVPLVTVKNSFGREFQIERDTYAHFAQLREALLKQGIQIELDSVYRSVARSMGRTMSSSMWLSPAIPSIIRDWRWISAW